MSSPQAPPKDGPAAQGELGRALLRAGRTAEAVAAFQRATALAPGWPPALVGLGVAQAAAGNPAEAEACYKRALAADPAHAAALRNLRILLISQERHDEALALAEAGLAAGADAGEAHLSRGGALFALGRHEAALAAFEAAAAHGADRYEVLTKIAAAEDALGRREAALEALDEAVRLKPGEALAPLRRALIRLAACDFAGGWDDYEARLDNEAFLAEAGPAIRQARGRLTVSPTRQTVRGRRVLALAEQGIGDQVMFASVLPDLVAEAGAVTCVCDPRLARLFARSFPAARVLGLPEAKLGRDEFDAILAMGSLAGLYRRRSEDFPGTPYLIPAEAARAAWAQRLGPRRGLRVGLSWRGGTPRTRAGERSIALAALTPLLDLAGCEFVSLQYGDAAGEVAAINPGRKPPLRVFPPEAIDDFDELAGLVANLDVVVSVQTALVHLAGALGREALVLVPRNAEWRYTADREAMPWYRSVRLFRQREDRSWAPVIARVAEALRERL